MTSARNVYFPNLNGLRFIAAMAVLVHHVQQLKFMFSLTNITFHPWVQNLGRVGVVLFFNLSGFLITYLLLEEEARVGIGVRQFYVRRMLRIWPLYYLIVVLALFVFPYVPFLTFPSYPLAIVRMDLPLKVILYGTLFANVVIATVGVVPYASQAWSIGTEEQFYLVWPLLMKHVHDKATLMLGVIAVYMIAVLYSPPDSGLGRFLAVFNIDCMAIGGLMAVLLHKRRSALTLLLNVPIFSAVLAITAVLLSRGISFVNFHVEIYSVLFAVLILNLAANDRLRWSMEYEPFHYLGRISYGLYMYQAIAIVTAIRVLSRLGWMHDLLLYPLSILGTIGISALSYRFLESPFLRLKERFTEVPSGERAKTDATCA